MTWTDAAVAVGFLLACIGFWAMLVAIVIWPDIDKDEDEQ